MRYTDVVVAPALGEQSRALRGVADVVGAVGLRVERDHPVRVTKATRAVGIGDPIHGHAVRSWRQEHEAECRLGFASGVVMTKVVTAAERAVEQIRAVRLARLKNAIPRAAIDAVLDADFAS